MNNKVMLAIGSIILIALSTYNGMIALSFLRQGIRLTKFLPLLVMYIILFIPLAGATFAGILALPHGLKNKMKHDQGFLFFSKYSGLLLLLLPVLRFALILLTASGFKRYKYLDSLAGLLTLEEILLMVIPLAAGVILLCLYGIKKHQWNKHIAS